MSKTRTLVCGSIAVDTIMVFPDRFGRHILPERTHMLSVSFHIGDMRREWGGCAGNIAYNLKALGGEPVILATVGSDGDAYRARFASLGISDEGVRTISGSFTAQAYIITDIDDNRRDEPVTRNTPDRCRSGRIGDRRTGRTRGDAIARVRAFRCRHSVRVRSRPGAAALLGRRAHSHGRSGRLRCRQRLRRPSALGADRTLVAGNRGTRRRADRNPRRGRLAHLRGRCRDRRADASCKSDRGPDRLR